MVPCPPPSRAPSPHRVIRNRFVGMSTVDRPNGRCGMKVRGEGTIRSPCVGQVSTGVCLGGTRGRSRNGCVEIELANQNHHHHHHHRRDRRMLLEENPSATVASPDWLRLIACRYNTFSGAHKFTSTTSTVAGASLGGDGQGFNCWPAREKYHLIRTSRVAVVVRNDTSPLKGTHARRDVFGRVSHLLSKSRRFSQWALVSL